MSSHQPQPHEVELRDNSGRTVVISSKCIQARKRYACPLCLFDFSRSYYVKIHMVNMHKKSTQIIKCNCGELFVTKADLKQHKITCLLYKYKCTICGRSYLNQRSLSKHMKRVHDFKKAECSLSPYVSSLKCNNRKVYMNGRHKQYFSSIPQSAQNDRPSPDDEDVIEMAPEEFTTKTCLSRKSQWIPSNLEDEKPEFFDVEYCANTDHIANSQSSNYDEQKNLFPKKEIGFVDMLDIQIDSSIPSVPQVITDPLSVGVEENVSKEFSIKRRCILRPLMNDAHNTQPSTDFSSCFEKNPLRVATSKQKVSMSKRLSSELKLIVLKSLIPPIKLSWSACFRDLYSPIQNHTENGF